MHVIYTLVCANCSEIVINGVVNPSEIDLCSGDDINITLVAPPVFSEYLGGSLKRGTAILSCRSKCCPVPGTILTHSVVYQCRNMEITDSGMYYGHVSISCGSNQIIHAEWCTPNVTINVRHAQNCSIGGLLYCMAQKFGSRKLWLIGTQNMFGGVNIGRLVIYIEGEIKY